MTPDANHSRQHTEIIMQESQNRTILILFYSGKAAALPWCLLRAGCGSAHRRDGVCGLPCSRVSWLLEMRFWF